MSYSSEVLADSPVAYYRLGEASGQPQDSSGNGNNTTTVNGTPDYSQPGAIASDPTNNAIQFLSASSERFGAPDHATLDLGDVFTMEAWVKLRSSGAERCIVAKGNGPGSTGAYGMYIEPAGELMMAKAGVAVIVTSTTAIGDTTTFHHVVATKSGTTSKLYIDAVDRTGTVTNATCVDNAMQLQIGVEETTGSSFASYFDGTLDEIAIYGTALSQARITAHFNAAAMTVPVAWLRA